MTAAADVAMEGFGPSMAAPLPPPPPVGGFVPYQPQPHQAALFTTPDRPWPPKPGETFFSIFVPGMPRTKNARRAFVVGGKARVVPGDKERESQAAIQNLVAAQRPPMPYEGPCLLKVTFVFPLPKSKKRERNPRHTGRPDTERLVGLIQDAFSAIVWKDDGQVDGLLARKKYGDVPGTIISVVAEGALPDALF